MFVVIHGVNNNSKQEIWQYLSMLECSLLHISEYTGDYNELVYLRARHYAPGTGRFLTKDTWRGNVNQPLSLNTWNYVQANPISSIDPTGHFSKSLIQASLNGQKLTQTFGNETFGVSRWALYALLQDAESWDRFSLRTADFSYEGPGYPLRPDKDGTWIVYEHGCQLVFLNSRWGYLSLPDFLNTIEHKADINTGLSDKPWRFSSLRYHWYEMNNKFYSDYYEWTDMPQLIMTTYSPFLEVGSLSYIRDMFGNQYYAASLGFPFGSSLSEGWEGYGSFNAPISQRSWQTLSESELKRIILGWSITGNASAVVVGGGFSLWRSGTIGLYGGRNLSAGGSLSIGYAWEAPAKDMAHRWDWIDQIRRYGPP
jgi:RHS repeat-associated protein